MDVYRFQVKAQSNFFMPATYVYLFPQLIAGPIVRYETIENELKNRKNNLNNIFISFRRFVIGVAKKVLIADQVAIIADKVFDTNVDAVLCFFAWLGRDTLQIYFDFRAHSDMTISLGRVFNFHFIENFDYPYSFGSIQEFGRRWYFPLGFVIIYI